jgi:hypothetical protein
MQVAGDKAAISGVHGRVSSTGARVETIGVVGVGVEVGIVTAGEIGRTGSIVGVFRGFEIEVGFSGKS